MSFPKGTSRTSLRRTFGQNSDQARFPNQYREELQRQASLEETARAASLQTAEAQNAPWGSLAQQNDPMKYGSVFRDQNKGIAGSYDAMKSAEEAESQYKMRKQQDDENYQLEQRRRSLLRPLRR